MQLVFVIEFHSLQDVLLLLEFLADTEQNDLCSEGDQKRRLDVNLPGVPYKKRLGREHLPTVNQGVSAPPSNDKVVCTE